MTRYLLSIFLTLALLPLLAGCADLDSLDMSGPDTPSIDEAYPYIPTLIRFEGLHGENELSRCSDIAQTPGYQSFRLEETYWLHVSCIRGSDGAQMTFSTTAWYTPQSDEEIRSYGTGPMLQLSWLDFDWLARPDITFPRTEHYTLHIHSTRFWTAQTNTIEWVIEVLDRHRFRIVLCGVDGEEPSPYQDVADGIGFVRIGEWPVDHK